MVRMCVDLGNCQIWSLSFRVRWTCRVMSEMRSFCCYVFISYEGSLYVSVFVGGGGE